MAAVVEDPLAQIPGGDRNNQNCTAQKTVVLGHHLRGGQKCVHSVQLLWLTQSQNCSAATWQWGALKYGAQLPTIVALVYCNCWPMVSMSGPWTSYLRFSTQRWLFNKVDILCLADQWNMRAKVMILWSKSPVTRNVIWKQATPRHCSTETAPELSPGAPLSSPKSLQLLQRGTL